MSAQPESWRVSTPEGIFETDLETLKQWIIEGCVLPTDKVSKGKLSWIEAGRAPMLRAAFSGEVSRPETASTVAAAAQQEPQPGAVSVAEATVPVLIAPHVGNVCHNHPGVPPKYICRICATLFCAECPKIVGASKIPICPLCGDLCRLFEEERSKVLRHSFQSSSFGFADLFRALGYPFQHKVALLFGAAIYGFLLLAGFRGQMVAFVIMFGCIAHVISQVAWGKLDRSFLPDFSAFSMWDDVAVPIGLGIGITIVTWGPIIVILLAFFFGVISGPKISPLGLPSPDEQATAIAPGDLDALTDPNADPKKLEEANKRLNQLRPGAQIAAEGERSKNAQSDPLANLRFLTSFIQVPWLLLFLLLAGVVWGVFYGPMALAVAGYTEDFGAVINPLVGLDTIRRMRGTYFKAFAMVIFIQVVSLVIAVIVGVILSPLDLPFFGNLPARFVDGSVTFYFNLVIACLLGLSLHKCADRLGIGVE